jgi:Protein of unknown function (DUF4012)
MACRRDSRAMAPLPPSGAPSRRRTPGLPALARCVRGSWRRLALLAAPAVMVSALAVDVGIRYLPAVRALGDGRTAATQAQALLRTDVTHLDRARVNQADALLRRASMDFGADSALVQDGWLADVAEHLPLLGDQVHVARALRQVGGAGTRLGLDVIPVARDLLPGSGGTAPTLTRVVTAAAGNRSALDGATTDIAALSAATAEVAAARVDGPLGSAQSMVIRDVPALINVVRPLRDVLEALSEVAAPGRHTYLLLLGNSAEERPGGGFIGSVGQVVLTDGTITSTSFRMSDFANSLVTSIPAPTALNQVLFAGRPWELSDANWSPDFPRSAAEVKRFYELATGETIDGVLGVDPTALGRVLGVLGPVQVPPYPQVITADNTLHEINEIINRARPEDPGNSYLAPLGQTILDRVLSAPVETYPRLASALAQAVQGRHIVMSFDDPRVQAVVAAYHADGSLSSTGDHDGVLVDDANVSGSKADLVVSRRFDLAVEVGADGTVHDRLSLTYHDAVPTDSADASLVRGSGGAYRDYLRVYLPADAQIDSLALTVDGQTQQVSPTDVTGEDGRLAVAEYLVVPSGSDLTLELDYHGDFAHRRGGTLGYQLVWTKQVQALSWPVQVQVTWPDGRRNHTTTVLDRDRSWTLTD